METEDDILVLVHKFGWTQDVIERAILSVLRPVTELGPYQRYWVLYGDNISADPRVVAYHADNIVEAKPVYYNERFDKYVFIIDNTYIQSPSAGRRFFRNEIPALQEAYSIGIGSFCAHYC